jgi:alpha,alpha-trehalase
MKSSKNPFILLLPLILLGACTNPQKETSEKPEGSSYFQPWHDLQPIFHDVQMAGVFEDSKTFVDCTPNSQPKELLDMYQEFKGQTDFNLKEFVSTNFELPASPQTYETSTTAEFYEHLNNQWKNLTRDGQQSAPLSTLIKCDNVGHN